MKTSKSTISRWFTPSGIPENKLPQSFVQAILGNCENHQTMRSEYYEQGTRSIKAPREPERERYLLPYVEIDKTGSGSGGENHAG